MGCEEKIEQQTQADLFDDLKSIELTPLPHFTHELLSLPEDMRKNRMSEGKKTTVR